MADLVVTVDGNIQSKETPASTDRVLLMDTEVSPNQLRDMQLANMHKALTQATSDQAGTVRLASDAETITGTATNRAVTPANLQALTASDTRDGIVELATNAEALAGTDTARALTAANLEYARSTSGWIPAASTWTYSSADSPSFVASIPDADAALLGSGDRIKLTQTTAKYFIITNVGTPSGGNTPVTIYGGTDYTLANATITSPFFSHQKSPLAFPLDPAKWMVKVTDTSDRTQSTPTQNTWYNTGSIAISIPIGAWEVDWKAIMYCLINGTAVNEFCTLSTANNSESDSEFTAEVLNQGATSASLGALTSAGVRKPLIVGAKTSYFLNFRTNLASVTSIALRGDISPTIVRARCAYL